MESEWTPVMTADAAASSPSLQPHQPSCAEGEAGSRFSGLTARLMAKGWKMQEGQRREFICGRESTGCPRQRWAVDRAHRMEARAHQTGPPVLGKSKMTQFKEEGRREDEVRKHWVARTGTQTPGSSTDSLLGFCDSFSCSVAGWEQKRG